MKSDLLSQLERVRDCLMVDRSEQRLAAQALRAGAQPKALQHLNTAFVANGSTETELADLRSLITQLKE